MCSTVADDLDGLSDADLLDRVRKLVAAQNRLAAQLARVVRHAENRQAAEHDGLTSIKSWLRTHTRLSGAAVAELVRHGRTLELLPAADAAFATGEVTADQVSAIGVNVRPENLDRAVARDVDLVVVEQALVTIATTQPYTVLQQAVGAYLARLDPDGREPDPTEERSLALVLIDEADLVDPATGPGAAGTGTGALLSAARTRRIACDSTVSRIVLGPDSAPIDLGRTQRIVSSAQRRALDARDRSCVFAGCEAPNRWCEAHHLLEWVFDGPTDLDNLGLLCERHHTKVHHGFRVQRQPDGRWRTWRPDGTEILPAPPLAVA